MPNSIKFKVCYSLTAFIFLLLGCSKDDMKTSDGPNQSGCQEPAPYQVNFPDGKLPWPHHAPGLDEAGYQELQDQLWIINNFGQYQCGDSQDGCYFHDGLDIVLENGTPIYVIEPGILKAIAGNGPYYWSVVVEDMDGLGGAWIYTHITPNPALKVGDNLPKGACLGAVSFQGLEHLHLSRAYLLEGGAWNRFSDWSTVSPDDYFIYTDHSPPVIEAPFYFFRNNFPDRFTRSDTTTVNGEVDIVVGIRDPGQYAHSQSTLYGDRLCVKRIEYEIYREGELLERRIAFDFNRMQLNRENLADKVATVFKFHLEMNPSFMVEDWNRFVSHYIITNSNGSGIFEPGEVGDKQYSWKTNALDEAGESLYPNGLYTIRVYAWDNRDNEAVAESLVLVDND